MNSLLRLVLALLIAAAAPAAAHASGGKKKEEVGLSPYVDLPTLTTAVIQPTGARGVLTVQAVLYAPDPVQRLKASKSVPLLLNAYLPALQAWAYRLPPGKAPNIDTLTRALQQSTDGVIGGGARVLLGGVMVN